MQRNKRKTHIHAPRPRRFCFQTHQYEVGTQMLKLGTDNLTLQCPHQQPLSLPLPTAEQWQAFLQTLNAIGIWEWAPNYTDPSVYDGCEWDIAISWGNTHIRSGGINRYPPGYNELMNAIDTLTRGRYPSVCG